MTTEDLLEGFGVTVGHPGGRASVAVRGEVDLVTAPYLAALLDAVIDQGQTQVVLDLAEVGFMDARGLRVIARGVSRLGGTGGGITVRSPSGLVTRLLAITGLAGAVSVEDPERADVGLAKEQLGKEQLGTAQLGREQTVAVPGAPVSVAAGLAAHLRRVTAIPADDDVVDGALRLVVALARATVGGADGVSVSLNRRGRLATVAASDDTILEMDADQYATGQGPCVDASTEGRWFHVESLDQESRWPAFVPKARKLGINAILSTPLVVEERPLGALNIYSNTPAAFAAAEQELASMFATEASVILRDAGADVADTALAGRIGEALASREVIALAQGVIMAREALSAERAHASLRRRSVRSGRPLRDVAVDLVASTQLIPPGAHSAAPGP